MKELTPAQRALKLKGFVFVAGVIAVVTVLFAVTEVQNLMATIVGAVSIFLVMASGVLYIFNRAIDLTYGVLVVGLGTVAGVGVGGFIVWVVVPALF